MRTVCAYDDARLDDLPVLEDDVSQAGVFGAWLDAGDPVRSEDTNVAILHRLPEDLFRDMLGNGDHERELGIFRERAKGCRLNSAPFRAHGCRRYLSGRLQDVFSTAYGIECLFTIA